MEHKTCETCSNGAYNRVENKFKCFELGAYIKLEHYKTRACKMWKTKVQPPREDKPKRGKKKWKK